MAVLPDSFDWRQLSEASKHFAETIEVSCRSGYVPSVGEVEAYLVARALNGSAEAGTEPVSASDPVAGAAEEAAAGKVAVEKEAVEKEAVEKAAAEKAAAEEGGGGEGGGGEGGSGEGGNGACVGHPEKVCT